MNESSLLWIFTFMQLLLIDRINATCTVTKDVTRTTKPDYNCRGYCQNRKITIEAGPLIYSCINTDVSEIHKYSQLKTNVENRIFVNDSSMQSLSPISMYYWKNLTELHMRNTKTSEIVPGFFTKFNDLQVLEITKNELKTIIDGVFSSLINLKMLNLSGNSIEALTTHSFSGLLNIEVLDLSKNKIASVSLEVLEYQKFLKQVDLSQNLIKDVGNIFDKPTIQSIQVSKNRLVDFDFNQFKHNSNLNKIDLSDNFIGDVKNLHLINANYISLSKNKIKKLDKVGNITFFNLSYNQIDILERGMLGTDIQVLDLSNNNINNLSENSFQNMPKLQYLYLSHNNIKLISRETLLNCNNLKHLDISFNWISQIPFGLFNNLNNLRYLDISNNQMILDFHTLATLKSLEVLNVQNNKIKNFDANVIMTRFKNLKSVSLGGNFWNCNELSITIHILQSHNITVSPENKTKESNILGIPCRDDADIKEDNIFINNNNRNYSQNDNKDKELVNNVYETSFQNISLILKRLDNISKQLSNQNNTNIPKNINENSFIQYLNKNFTKSSFYKYMENFKLVQNKTLDFNAQMMDFLGDRFNETNFYKYLNSLKINQINIASDHVTHPYSNVLPIQMNQTEVLLNSMNKTVSNMSHNVHQILLSLTSSRSVFKDTLENRNNLEILREPMKYESQAQATTRNSYLDKIFTDNLIFTNILLTLILCCLMAHLYYNFWRPKKNVEMHQEQVQLM